MRPRRFGLMVTRRTQPTLVISGFWVLLPAWAAAMSGCASLGELPGDVQHTLRATNEAVREVTQVSKELRSEYRRLEPRLQRLGDQVETLTVQSRELIVESTEVARNLDAVACELMKLAEGGQDVAGAAKTLFESLTAAKESFLQWLERYDVEKLKDWLLTDPQLEEWRRAIADLPQRFQDVARSEVMEPFEERVTQLEETVKTVVYGAQAAAAPPPPGPGVVPAIQDLTPRITELLHRVMWAVYCLGALIVVMCAAIVLLILRASFGERLRAAGGTAAVLLVVAFVWPLSGCAGTQYEWHVFLNAITEEVRPPDQPAWLRTNPAEKAEAIEERQLPLRWAVVEERTERPFRDPPGFGTEWIAATVREGVNPNSRSSAVAGATKNQDGLAVSLFSRTSRQRFHHAQLAASSAVLQLYLPPNAGVWIDCAPYECVHFMESAPQAETARSPQVGVRDAMQIELDSALEQVGLKRKLKQLVSPRSDTLAEPLIDESQGLLFISCHPEWHLTESPGEVTGATGNIAGGRQVEGGEAGDLQGRVMVRVPRELALISKSKTDLVIPLEVLGADRGTYLIEVRNATSKARRGYVSFRVVCYNDWQRTHALFTESHRYVDQLAAWQVWKDVWSGALANTGPRIVRSRTAGVELRARFELPGIQTRRGRAP